MRLIDADALVKKIVNTTVDQNECIGETGSWLNGCANRQIEILDMIDESTTVDAAPVVHGHWILLDNCSNEGHYCSVCNKKIGETNKFKYSIHKYCHNCGAKMDEV